MPDCVSFSAINTKRTCFGRVFFNAVLFCSFFFLALPRFCVVVLYSLLLGLTEPNSLLGLPPPRPSLVLRRRVLDSERAELLDPLLSLDDLTLPHGVLHAPVARCNESLAAVFRLCFQRWTGRPLEYLGESPASVC